MWIYSQIVELSGRLNLSPTKNAEFGESDYKISLDEIIKKVEVYNPKERVLIEEGMGVHRSEIWLQGALKHLGFIEY